MDLTWMVLGGSMVMLQDSKDVAAAPIPHSLLGRSIARPTMWAALSFKRIIKAELLIPKGKPTLVELS